MDKHIINAMVKALTPALKDRVGAEKIMARFWQSRMALVWTAKDVHTAANEREVALTNEEAVKVLHELHRCHNKQYGLKWEDVTAYIYNHCFGRKLTRLEVKRFVEKNILTIQR